MSQARASHEEATATCQGELGRATWTRAEAEAVALLLKAVADPVRLQLLSVLRSAPGFSACVCDLTPAVGLSQPTVSHHLKVLTDAGLLTRERRGPWAWFTLAPSRLAEIGHIFD